MPRSHGRTGHRWRQARAACLAASNICWLCGQPGATTVDHIVPVSHLPYDHPLLTDPGNLRPACKTCNSSRGTGTTPTTPTSRRW